MPRIKIPGNTDEEQEEAKSGIQIPEYKITDFLRLEVLYDETYEESLNKSITSYTATSVSERILTFNVEFAKPSDISTDINELDYL